MASERDRRLMAPGLMLSDKPVTPLKASCGKPQSGPGRRGNSRNSSSTSGTACSSSSAAVRSSLVKRRCPGCSPIRLALITSTVSSISAAVGSDCE